MPSFSQLYGDASNRCSVAISNSYDSCGTITRANVSYATPAGLASIFQDGSGVWRDMESLLASQLELKACGIKQYALYDWLMSSARGVGHLVNQRKVKGSESLMEPFILANQKSIINSDYWAISLGWAAAGGGGYTAGVTGPLAANSYGTAPYSTTANQRIVRIISRQGLDSDRKWFPFKSTIHIFSRSSGGTAQRGAWLVLDSAVAADNSYVDLLIYSNNSNSNTPFDSQPGQTVSTYFHSGVVVIGTNNVQDWESWCNNRPALNPNRLIPFWFQTSRYTLCIDEMYKEWLAYLMERNPLFAKFGDVPIAERNKQLGAMFQREWLNSFFWGKALPNQALSTWQSLEQVLSYNSSIFDTGTEGKLMAYKANSIGVYEQLRQCGRIKDLQGQTLNLVEFFDDLYQIVRSRSSQGKEASSIDVWTDTYTAQIFQRAMVQYYNNESGGLARYNYNMGASGVIPSLGFKVKSYELNYPQGVQLNILTDWFFDDFASVHSAESIGDAGRFLMVLDLGGGIYPGIIGSKRKVHTVGAIEELSKIDSSFACVMENPTREIALNSTTWGAIVECPSDNLILENFRTDVDPSAGGRTYPYSDSYV